MSLVYTNFCTPPPSVFSPYFIFDNVKILRFFNAFTEGQTTFLPFSIENIDYIGRMLMVYYLLPQYTILGLLGAVVIN